MKIVGLTYYDGQYRMAVKSDSSLLNQGKPFFIPDWSEDIRGNRCTVLRINRLGRSIEPRFAVRYYDAMAMGIDFQAADLLREGKTAEGLAFDGALCVGEWLQPALYRTLPDTMLNETEQVCTIEQTIARISRIMTIRIGDIIYIDAPREAEPVQRENITDYGYEGQNILYCKIK
ncbi:MAG: fumarylacetoacetate hydrolase family protein [Paludibacteraceae bacterium]|nr:fumarylacetoacetate hydrolase family protein [Paludibacteraceae bacterium]